MIPPSLVPYSMEMHSLSLLSLSGSTGESTALTSPPMLLSLLLEPWCLLGSWLLPTKIQNIYLSTKLLSRENLLWPRKWTRNWPMIRKSARRRKMRESCGRRTRYVIFKYMDWLLLIRHVIICVSIVRYKIF